MSNLKTKEDKIRALAKRIVKMNVTEAAQVAECIVDEEGRNRFLQGAAENPFSRPSTPSAEHFLHELLSTHLPNRGES